MELPLYVKKIIDTLHKDGHEAYAVGGCVRDALLGKVPDDYDVCTSALPDQIKTSFKDMTVLSVGEKHGTITVISEAPVEITTFRTEGGYSDSRHPDKVSFVGRVEEDLSRRDFTINAMAFSPEKGLIDPFGGREDLRRGIIRCVGDASERFLEDGLRIMRALRFASVYDFDIEENTMRALHERRELLRRISPERIFSEMCKLLQGRAAHVVLDGYVDVVGTVIPELLPMVGFDQHSLHHHLDVWQHTLGVLKNSFGDDLAMRWSALLHDCQKPECFSLDENGRGHFKGHQERGAQKAFEILTRLRCDKKTKKSVVSLIANHDLYFCGDIRDMRRLINKLGRELPLRIFRFRVYDSMAQNPSTVKDKLLECERAMSIYKEVADASLCCFVSELDINGDDLINLGLNQGKNIKIALESLLDAVIDGKCKNNKADLVVYAQKNIIRLNK